MSKEKKQLPGKKEETCVIVDSVKELNRILNENSRDEYSTELLHKVESFLTDVQTKLIGIIAVNHTELNFGNIIICDKAGIMSSISESLTNEISKFAEDLNKIHYNK